MTVVAISQRTLHVEKYDETRDCLDQRWHDFFAQCSLTPILIPNHLVNAQQILNNIDISGIVLTGGNDSSARNQVEHYLISHAINSKLPTLGVCHGMQAIQRYFNITLTNTPGHITAKQEIHINNRMALVNSYHELGSFETTQDFPIFAKASDGVIKGIYHTTLPIIGFMWHPERFEKFDPRDINLVTSLFSNNYSNKEIWGNVCKQLF